jgi:hypothetical protein
MPRTVPLEVFAEINARIAGGAPRDEVLAAASVEDAQFEAAQAFWLGRMSEEARAGRIALAPRYAQLFAAAQKALATPKKPERRVWRMAAPAKVAYAMPGVGASGATASSAGVMTGGAGRPSAALATGPYAARLTLEQFAAFRADLVLADEAEHPAVWDRYGLDAVTWPKEDAHWQAAFAGDRDLFQRYLRQFQYCKALMAPRG